MAHQVNPKKQPGSEKFFLCLQEMFDGWAKEDPPKMKKLSVEVDVPELLAKLALVIGATELTKAIGDNCMIAFYYLLRIGGYTVKVTRNNSKHTVRFKLEDVTFFINNALGKLRQLPWSASNDEIMTAEGATLKLDNQKNGWKGLCVHQEHNGDIHYCAIRALRHRYFHIRWPTSSQKILLLAYYVDGIRYDVTDQDIRDSIKWAAKELNYPATKGIPIDIIDTHSLCSGGANALALDGYLNTQIQKWGDGEGQLPRSIFARNLHATPRECPVT